MPVMRNFQKIIKRTRESYGLPDSSSCVHKKTHGVKKNGEVLAVLDLWASNVQAASHPSPGRNRAGVRREGGPQAADGQGEEAGSSCSSPSEAEALA